MADQPGTTLCETLADFTNFALAGLIPPPVRPLIFGATLTALSKEGGGLRPIAVGLTLRRLICKAAALLCTPICAPYLSPFQVGVGTKGGAEALVHATRHFLKAKSPEQAFVKLDFTNAFNTLRRDAMLEAVATVCPGLLPLAISAYASPSTI